MRKTYIWVQRLDFNISGHSNTNTAGCTSNRTTSANNIGTTTTITTATTSYLCEWFVCVTAAVGVSRGGGIVHT